MSDIFADEVAPLGAPTNGVDRGDAADRIPPVARYGLSLLFVALATAVAFAVETLVSPANVTLIYVLPIVVAATSFGFGPSLGAVVASVLAFDFFFTEPLYSFRIYSASDLWAAVLLFVVAAIVSAVAAEARRRALDARRASEQARALQALAHVIIRSRPQAEVVQAAAAALSDIFRAPAVVLTQDAGVLRPAATAGAAKITSADEEAARGALDTRLPTRAGTYPYDASTFDFWPIAVPAGCLCVVGVSFRAARRERAIAPERFIEIVGAYLAVAFKSADAGRSSRP